MDIGMALGKVVLKTVAVAGCGAGAAFFLPGSIVVVITSIAAGQIFDYCTGDSAIKQLCKSINDKNWKETRSQAAILVLSVIGDGLLGGTVNGIAVARETAKQAGKGALLENIDKFAGVLEEVLVREVPKVTKPKVFVPVLLSGLRAVACTSAPRVYRNWDTPTEDEIINSMKPQDLDNIAKRAVELATSEFTSTLDELKRLGQG